MKYPLILALWIGFLAVSFTVFGQDSYYGSATYTPQQLHELLVGQAEPAVIQAFGRLPNLVRGRDWFYENVAVYVPEYDRYYTLAVVCFSQADGRVWQVVCYPH